MARDPDLQQLTSFGRIARDTRKILARALIGGGTPLTMGDRINLDEARDHLGQIHVGFVATLRTGSFRDRAELAALVHEVIIDWAWLPRAGIRWFAPEQALERPVAQVLAFAHAAVALGSMPRLPAFEVTFPLAGRTYADIPVPHTPGETLERIEEIEAVIARGAEEPLRRFSAGTVRRAYGFFETSAWLSNQYLKALAGRG